MIHTVTIDLRLLEASGIGTYLRNTVPLLVKNLPDVRFVLLGNSPAIAQLFLPEASCQVIQCAAPLYSCREQVELLYKIPRSTDLLWSPHYVIPVGYQGKLLVTVHDLFHLAMPQYVSGKLKQLYAQTMFYFMSRKAREILCISQFTADELAKYTGRRRHVQVIANGVAAEWFQIQRSQPIQARPYLLFVGNVKPHKNLLRLLQAFAIIQDKIPHNLLIVGKKTGFITPDREVFTAALQLGNRVTFTGYIDDVSLQQLYASATALIFPSTYEGFGLPPLEAMACGCPVVAANCAALPEVCGEAALYCDPYQVQDMAEKMLQVINNTELRDQLIPAGKAQAARYSWRICAQQIAVVMEGVLSQ